MMKTIMNSSSSSSSASASTSSIVESCCSSSSTLFLHNHIVIQSAESDSIVNQPPPPPPAPFRRFTSTSSTTATNSTTTTTTTTTTTIASTKILSAKEQLLSFNRNKLIKTTTKVRTADGRVYQEQISGDVLVSSYIGLDETNQFKKYNETTEILPYFYSHQQSKWIVYKASSPLLIKQQQQQQPITEQPYKEIPSPLSIITFNVWFDSYLWRQRATAMFRIIEERLPDFICLQEVTPTFLAYLLEQPWTRQHYLISDCGHSDTVFPYGNIIMVKNNNKIGYQLKSYIMNPLPTRQNRKVLTALIQLDSGALMSVSTVHLESLESSKELRIQQLQAISKMNQERKQKHLQLSNQKEIATFLVGDFNFGANTLENKEMFKQSFIDLWTQINPSKESITCIKKNERVDRIVLWCDNNNNNSLNNQQQQSIIDNNNDNKQQQQQQTFDFSKSTINILGSEPIDIDNSIRMSEQVDCNELIYPSDHFGLYTSLV